jgi:transposase
MRLSKEANEFRRRTIVRLHQEGYKQGKIAELTDCSQQNVSLVLSNFKKEGEGSYRNKTKKGADSRMEETQKEELRSILLIGADEFGFLTKNWTQKRVAVLIYEKFGISYNSNYISRFLRKMSFSLQKPSSYNYRKKAEDATIWRADTLPELKKK